MCVLQDAMSPSMLASMFGPRSSAAAASSSTYAALLARNRALLLRWGIEQVRDQITRNPAAL